MGAQLYGIVNSSRIFRATPSAGPSIMQAGEGFFASANVRFAATGTPGWRLDTGYEEASLE